VRGDDSLQGTYNSLHYFDQNKTQIYIILM
jgi:hypothetical protein